MSEKVESRKITTEPDYLKITHGEGWWHTGPYKGPNTIPVKEGMQNFGVFNPDCKGKHDHTSNDIMNCEECIAYSKVYEQEWKDGKRPIPINEGKGEKDDNAHS